MKLYYSATSPFVQKVIITAAELGIHDQIERLDVSEEYRTRGPLAREHNIARANPLGQVPTLISDDEMPISDSRVICEYLDAKAGGNIFPGAGPKRWAALFEQSIADGLINAALSIRYERLRPEDIRWTGWTDGQYVKINAVLMTIEQRVAGRTAAGDIGSISIACALSYLDFRFPDLEWRKQCPSAATWHEAMLLRPSFADNPFG